MTKKVNVASGLTWTYSYNNANRLREADRWTADPDSGGLEAEAVTYTYDAFGNRLEQSYFYAPLVGPVVQRYAYDGWDPAKPQPVGNENFDVWADLDGGNSLQTRYLRGDQVDQLFARVDVSGTTATPYWYLTDRLGSVRDVVDGSGAVKDAIQYDGFGNIASETDGSYRGRYAWTGRELDVETGLQYNRARYYDSGMGRWLTEDPLGLTAGDSNLYRYASNRSTAYSDPSGLAVANVTGMSLLTSNGAIPPALNTVSFGTPTYGEANPNKLGPYNDPNRDGDFQNVFWLLVTGTCLDDAVIYRSAAGTITRRGVATWTVPQASGYTGPSFADDGPSNATVKLSPKHDALVVADAPGTRSLSLIDRQFSVHADRYFPADYKAKFVVRVKSRSTGKAVALSQYEVTIAMAGYGNAQTNAVSGFSWNPIIST